MKSWRIGAVLALYPALGAAESLTMTTYYPAPMGIYRSMTTTSATRLSRDAGQVGIGLFDPTYPIDPTYKLDVDGSIRARNFFTGDGKQLKNFWDATGDSIFNTNSGLVGIGTASPTHPLTVGDMGGGHPLALQGTTSSEIVFDLQGRESWEAGLHGDDSFTVHGGGPTSVRFDMHPDTGRMVIGPNVVGSTPPAATLEVIGNAYLSNPGSGVILRSPSGATCAKLGVADDGSIDFSVVACP